MVRQGAFRSDLYSRLAQWVIRIPPLRDRREDIPALTRSLLSGFGAPARMLEPDFAEALLVHPWPLNVRGLSNVLSIALIATPAGRPLALVPEIIAALHDNRTDHENDALQEAVVVLDHSALDELLRRFHGRVAEAARHVGLSRPKLYRMLWAEAIDPASFREA